MVIHGPQRCDRVVYSPRCIHGRWRFPILHSHPLLNRFVAERIVTGYLWIWICCISCAILYTLLFFQLRGNILVVTSFPRFRLIFRRRSSPSAELDDVNQAREVATNTADAKKMLIYPISYLILVTPLSVTRWLTFTGHFPSPAATVAAAVIFKLSGLVNVIVFMLTRPGLLLFRRNEPNRTAHREEVGIPLEVIRVGRPSGSRRTSPQNTGSAHNTREATPEVPPQTTGGVQITVNTSVTIGRVTPEPPRLPVPRFMMAPTSDLSSSSRPLPSQWFEESEIGSVTQRSDGDMTSVRSEPRLPISAHRMSSPPPPKQSTRVNQNDRALSPSPPPSTFLDL